MGTGYKGNKTPILGMVERNGNVMTKAIPNRKRVTLEKHIFENVKPHTEINTDEFTAYSKIGYVKGYWHQSVNNSAGEYVRENVSTNTIESFWSQLKRAITGTHIHVSSKHLWKYAKGAEFRFNRRSCPETMFSDLISDFVQGSSKQPQMPLRRHRGPSLAL